MGCWPTDRCETNCCETDRKGTDRCEIDCKETNCEEACRRAAEARRHKGPVRFLAGRAG